MDGKTFADIIEEELYKRKISKGEFYDAVGITAAAMWGWKMRTPKKCVLKSL